MEFLPETGRGTTRRVVEGHVRFFRRLRAGVVNICTCPSTMLRMVPLPREGRIA
jgi:hypothetical protein